MGNAAKKIEEHPDLPINRELLQRATKAREAWNLLKDRMTKIEQNKASVSPKVYERVYRDYAAKLEEARDNLLEKKQEIDTEASGLKLTQKKIATELEEHKQELEELKFRHSLEEFTAGEFQELAKRIEEKIAKFGSIMSAVNTNLSQYESIFEEVEELFGKLPDHTSEVKNEVAGKTGKILHDPSEATREPQTDEHGYILEEERPSYFAEGATDSIADETSDKTEPALEVEEKAKEVKTARLVVIDGKDLGSTYQIKGTASFGRADSNLVVLKDAKASRQHSQIQKKGKEYVIADLNSSNGTYVNGEKIEEHVLSDGDEIQIGDTVIQFQV